MKLLIKKAIIISSSSPFNGQSADILIENGIITSIAGNLTADADKIIQEKGLHASSGWVDCFANFCDPGNEYKETLETGANAAAAGGFTDVMLVPDTNPSIHNKTQIEYIVQKSKELPVTIHPIGAISKNAEGKELCEMYDMKKSGAVAFSDGKNSLQSSGLMLKALQYVLPFNGTIIQLPHDKNIDANGLMNEGIISTRLGLPGSASIAEELMIARDIELARYTNSCIHFTGVSTRKSLELIIDAKKQHVHVSCSVTPYHIYFCDEDLQDYDTNLKVNPPLRTRTDMDFLRDAVRHGLVDFIASHHQPQSWDDKICEFEYAQNGMIGLESLFGVLSACDIDVINFVHMQTENIRRIFNLPLIEIKEKQRACLTLFNPDTEYIFSQDHIQSKSNNSAFLGKKLRGNVFGIINADKLFLKN